jgi:hypothetical protein
VGNRRSDMERYQIFFENIQDPNSQHIGYVLVESPEEAKTKARQQIARNPYIAGTVGRVVVVNKIPVH